ncbi:MAG: hypothetical protein HRT67_04150 [Flavobacteriaceae bacterium]|nr:hypothetical protein [Flavobacteriaceae bacterium]
MKIPTEIRDSLNLALNESRLTEFSIDRKLNQVSVILETVAMNKDLTIPEDSRVVITFNGVSRVAGKLKLGEWNDESAKTEKFEPEELSEKLMNYNGHSMYGWEFINVENSEKEFQKWQNNSSFDISLVEGQNDINTIDIFSEHFSEKCKTLDLRIWFEELEIESFSGISMTTQEFIDRGERGWNAIYNGNEGMTKAHGIVAASNEKEKTLHTTRAIPNKGFIAKLKDWFS